MDLLPTDAFSVLAQSLTLKDILSLATTNQDIRDIFLRDDINTKLANYYGFPYGITLVELKKYESLKSYYRLNAAAEMQDERIINKLLEIGNIEDVREAIRILARKGNKKLMHQLINYHLKKGENPEEAYKVVMEGVLDPEEAYNAALEGAAFSGHEDIINEMIELGANEFDDAMVEAARGNQEKIVQRLLGMGIKNTFGQTYGDAMIEAARNNNEKIFDMVMIASYGGGGYTRDEVLYAIIEIGNIKFVKKILDHGASVTESDVDLARENGYEDIAELLEAHM